MINNNHIYTHRGGLIRERSRQALFFFNAVTGEMVGGDEYVNAYEEIKSKWPDELEWQPE